MGGVEPLWFSKVSHTMLARLMESQIWYLPASFVAVRAFLSRRKLSSRSCLDARHFSSSLYVTGAFQAATLVLEVRGHEFKLLFEFFKRNCLGCQKFFS